MKRSVSSAMRFWCPGDQDHLFRPVGRSGDGTDGMVQRGPDSPAHPAGAMWTTAFIEAQTTYGTIGIKVFLFKGEVLNV